jgi:Arc/MetJ-type ribon-helix-helix transcriptional regulator
MAFTLNPATEQRIERELERGHYASPDEVIAQALDLLEVLRKIGSGGVAGVR